MKRIAYILGIVSIILGFTVPIASAQSERYSANLATPRVQVCDLLGSHDCMNRQHGGVQSGTWVVAYNLNDNNNDFTVADSGGVSWCGGSNWVHNGENGLVCPFSVGSGLNARYDKKAIVQLYNYTYGWCANANFSDYSINLGACGNNGYLWVDSPDGSSGDWFINVGQSNYAYGNGGPSNQPYWLGTLGTGLRMVAGTWNNNPSPFGCVGSGEGLC